MTDMALVDVAKSPRGVASRITRLWTPNAIVSRHTLIGIALTQLVIAIALWSIAPASVIPSPAEILRALASLWMHQGLARETATSVALNVEAIAIATLLSLIIAYASVIPAMRPLGAVIAKGRFLGMAGLTLLFTLSIGGGRALKLALLVFGVTVFFVTAMRAVIAGIRSEAFDHARTLGFGEWRVLYEVVVAGTFADALDLLRQNAAIGWMMLTMVEGISRADGGLGAMLLNQNKHFHLAEVFAIQLVIVVVGVAQDAFLGWLRRTVCPYAVLETEQES